MRFNVTLLDRGSNESLKLVVEGADAETVCRSFDSNRFIIGVTECRESRPAPKKPFYEADWSTPEGKPVAWGTCGVILYLLVWGFVVVSNPPALAPGIIAGALLLGFGILIVIFLAKIASGLSSR